MKNLFLTLAFFSFIFSPFAQGNPPKVPSEMKFAGIRLSLDAAARSVVQKKVNNLMFDKAAYETYLERCNLYFPFIEKAFTDARVPIDFKYLAIQESALVPDVVSKSKAVGFWQFKDFTARELGLRVDKQIDERKNIVASSKAAAKYLKKNNYFMKNWIYAMLSYNMGLTGANQKMDRKYVGAKSLQLDKNTPQYILHFLANRLAFQGNLNKRALPSLTLFEYPASKGKTLDDIARTTTLSKTALKSYNRWLQIGYIPTDKEYSFLLPIPNQRKNELLAKLNLGGSNVMLASLKENSTSKTNSASKLKLGAYPKLTKKETKKIGNQTFTFVTANGISAIIAGKGQAVATITSVLNLPQKRFLKYNDMTLVDNITEGQVYYLKGKKGKAKTAYHVTQKGQSIWEVSQMYGIKLKSLLKKNRLTPNPQLKTGRVLFLQKKRKKTVPIEIRGSEENIDNNSNNNTNSDNKNGGVNIPVDTLNTDAVIDTTLALVNNGEKEDDYVFNPNAKFYQVRKGETLFAVARLYQVTTAELIEWNDLGTNLDITVGQILQVRPNGATTKNTAGNSANTTSNNENDFEVDVDIPMIDENGNITSDAENDGKKGGVATTNATKKVKATNIYHTVAPNETLYRVARKYGATVQQITFWNKLAKDAQLNAGTKLIVGKEYPKLKEEDAGKFGAIDNNLFDTATDSTASNNTNTDNTNAVATIRKTHIVAKGEGLWSIARKYNVTTNQIYEWNGIEKNEAIKIDQELIVSPPIANDGKTNNTSSNDNGATNKDASKDIFGGNTATENTDIFGGNTATNTENTDMFGGNTATNTATENTDMFGGNTDNNTVKGDEAQPLIHTVADAENINIIAQKYNVDTEDIRKWNGIPVGIPLAVGQKLVVSGKQVNGLTSTGKVFGDSTKTAINTSENSIVKDNTATGNLGNTENTTTNNTDSNDGNTVTKVDEVLPKIEYHTVKKNEGLWGIARKYGVSVADIKAWNKVPSSGIRVGQQLVINKGKSGNTENTASSDGKKYHKVKSGETLYSVAKKYSVSTKKIIAWNGLKSNSLKAGQKLIVKDDSSTIATTNASGEIYHTVKYGEGLWGIAKKYGVSVDKVKKMNGLSNNSIVKGQTLRIK